MNRQPSTVGSPRAKGKRGIHPGFTSHPVTGHWTQAHTSIGRVTQFFCLCLSFLQYKARLFWIFFSCIALLGTLFPSLGFPFFFFPCQISTVLRTVVVLDTRNSMGFSSDPGPGWFTVGPGSITTKQVRQTSLGQARIALLNSYCCVARLALFLVAALPLRQLFTPGSSVTNSPPPKRPKQSRSSTAPS